jgi:Xaa-Pro aminopeptidase
MRFTIALLTGLTILAATTPAQTITTTAADFRARRAAVAKAIGEDAVFIAFSSAPMRRTGDVDFPFRQEDNLLYLTGVDAPDTTLVMLPGESTRRERIFASDLDPANERWTGQIASTDEVAARTGIADVESSRRVNSFVDAIFQGGGFAAASPASYYATPIAPHFTAAFRAGRAQVWLLLADRGSSRAPTREQQFADDLRRRYPEVTFRDASPLLNAMREIKSPVELSLIQRAVDVTVEAQKAAMARVLTASHEYEVQATVEFTFRNLGACCWAFPSIVAAGTNATTLHYESNNEPIVRGGLLLTDLGAEVEGYSADVTRTYPANGTFTPAQRAIYLAVLAAQNETLPLMKPGHRFIEIQQKATDVIGRELLKLGLVTKNTPEQVGLYFFHGPGHPLGLQTHDVYDRLRLFEPNMVFTNEPGVYVRQADVLASDEFKKLTASEQQTLRAALATYDGIGVRIEDDVQITAGEPKVLSAGAPRTPDAIEAWMASKR